MKVRRRKTPKLKRRNAPTAGRQRSPLFADLQKQLALRARNLREALEQQKATSEELRVISNSSGDLQTVFETILANATRLCEAKFGILWLREGHGFRCVALHNAPSAFADQRRLAPVVYPGTETGLGCVMLLRSFTFTAPSLRLVHIIMDYAP